MTLVPLCPFSACWNLPQVLGPRADGWDGLWYGEGRYIAQGDRQRRTTIRPGLFKCYPWVLCKQRVVNDSVFFVTSTLVGWLSNCFFFHHRQESNFFHVLCATPFMIKSRRSNTSIQWESLHFPYHIAIGIFSIFFSSVKSSSSTPFHNGITICSLRK